MVAAEDDQEKQNNQEDSNNGDKQRARHSKKRLSNEISNTFIERAIKRNWYKQPTALTPARSKSNSRKTLQIEGDMGLKDGIADRVNDVRNRSQRLSKAQSASDEQEAAAKEDVDKANDIDRGSELRKENR